jgi:hypothetical protein
MIPMEDKKLQLNVMVTVKAPHPIEDAKVTLFLSAENETEIFGC